MSRDSHRKPQARRVDGDVVPVQRRSATPGATNAAYRRYAGVRRDPDAPKLDTAAAYAAGEAHRAAVQRKAALDAASPDPYDPFDMIAARREPVQRKAVTDAMDAPKEDSIREDRATIEAEPAPARGGGDLGGGISRHELGGGATGHGDGVTTDMDAPKEDSIQEDRATIDPNAEPGATAAPHAAGGHTAAHADTAVADMDAPKEDSIQEDRATIEADDGKAAASSGPLGPAKATRAARKNRHWARRLHLSPAAFGASAGVGTPAFAQAVAQFQAAHGLTVDGVAGPKTAAALHGGSSGGDAVASRGSRPEHETLLQMKSGGGRSGDADIQGIAAAGVQGSGQALPHIDHIQASFGAHDVSGIRAHVGGTSAKAASAIGADAYATGNNVAFRSSPDLHTAAHEAAHVVQQRAGVQLKGGIGRAGDAYEQQADAVADLVVRGESAETMLGEATHVQPDMSATQRKESEGGLLPSPQKKDFGDDAKGQLMNVIEAIIQGIRDAQSALLEPKVEDRDDSLMLELLKLTANAIFTNVAKAAGEAVSALVAGGMDHEHPGVKLISSAASSSIKEAISMALGEDIAVKVGPSLLSTFSAVESAKIMHMRVQMTHFANRRFQPLLRTLPKATAETVSDLLGNVAEDPEIIAAQKRATLIEWTNFCARATYGSSKANHMDVNRWGPWRAGILDTHNPGFESGSPAALLKIELIRRGPHGLASGDWELRGLSLGGVDPAVVEEVKSFSTIGEVPLNKLVQVFSAESMYEDPSPVACVLLTAANGVANADYDEIEDRKVCPASEVAEAVRLFGLSKLK